jgi:hypothetical protein
LYNACWPGLSKIAATHEMICTEEVGCISLSMSCQSCCVVRLQFEMDRYRGK